MGSVNRVILAGHLGRDPEIRSTADGTKIANLSLATSEGWTDKRSGERREKTEWHRVVIFNERLVEVAEKYIVKGSQVYIEGALQTRKWQDQNGAERYSTEVVLQRFRGELVILGGGKDRREERSEPQPREAPRGAHGAPAADDFDDSIPFLPLRELP